MGSVAINLAERYTYADYLRWDDGERWELIDGKAYNMTPAPSRKHQDISGEIFRQISNYLVGKPCRVYPAPFDVRIPEGSEADDAIANVVQPDLVVVCDPTKLDERGCIGSPDLVVEILSPATARKDIKEKFLLYERAGVREYWIVDPAAATVMVFRRGEDGRFGRPDVYSAEDRPAVGIFSDLAIDLSTVFPAEQPMPAPSES